MAATPISITPFTQQARGRKATISSLGLFWRAKNLLPALSSQRFPCMSHWPEFSYMPFPKPPTNKKTRISVTDIEKSKFSPWSWCLGKLYLKHMTSQSSVSMWTRLRVLLAENNNAIWFSPHCNECFSIQTVLSLHGSDKQKFPWPHFG